MEIRYPDDQAAEDLPGRTHFLTLYDDGQGPGQAGRRRERGWYVHAIVIDAPDLGAAASFVMAELPEIADHPAFMHELSRTDVKIVRRNQPPTPPAPPPEITLEDLPEPKPQEAPA